MKTRTAVAVWTLTLVCAAGVSGAVITSDHAGSKGWTLALAIPTGLAFVASGLVASSRRPENATGLLLIAVGLGSFVGALQAADDAVLFTLGSALQWVYYGPLVHVVLAFPSGRIATNTSRIVVAASYALGVAMLPLLMMFEAGHAECARGPCPKNVLELGGNARVSGMLEDVHLWVALAVAVAAAVEVARRWGAAGETVRRAGAAIYVSFGAMLAAGALAHVAEAAAPDLLRLLNWVFLATLLTIPLAFLFGLLRSRLGRATERLVVELAAARPGAVRPVLARALGDPTLELAYATRGGGLVDLAGSPVALPPAGSGRCAKIVERDGTPVAALIHDDSLKGDPLVDAASAAAGLALENERLQAELRARLEELHASRARIVRTADEERRRLERNLHDGAQQRLVTLSLALRLARSKLEDDPAAAREILAAAGDELSVALSELRDLARGLHPAVLTERGLPAALQGLAARAPIPVEVEETLDERLPEPVEVAAFYLVSEALTNVAKYAHASSARVSVARRNGIAVVAVTDDGVGGASTAAGSGLRGLADRVEALDGRLEVVSRPGKGTVVRAEIPCADRSAGAP